MRLRRRSELRRRTRADLRYGRRGCAARRPAGRRGPEEERVLVRRPAHRGDVQPRGGQQRRRRRAASTSTTSCAVELRRSATSPRLGTATGHAACARASRRGAGVVAQALVARRAASPDGHAERRRPAAPPSAAAVSRIAGHLDGGGAERRAGADDARAHARRRSRRPAARDGPGRAPLGTDTASRSPPNACPAVTVPASRPPSRHGRHEVGQGERQGGAVGHHVGDPRRRGATRADRHHHRGHLAVQPAHHHRHAVERRRAASGCCSSAPPVSTCRLV